MAKNQRCVAHRYRPSTTLCKTCGKGICEECQRLHASLCPGCANIPGGNASRFQTSPQKSPEPTEKTFTLTSLPPIRLPSEVKGRAKVAGVVLLCVTLGVLIILGAMGRGPFPFRPRPLGAVEADRVVRQNLYLAVAAIDAFKHRTGRLPKTLNEIGMGQDPSYSYEAVSKERYIISQTKYGKNISYDSSVAQSNFFGDLAPPTNPSVGEAATPTTK